MDRISSLRDTNQCDLETGSDIGDSNWRQLSWDCYAVHCLYHEAIDCGVPVLDAEIIIELSHFEVLKIKVTPLWARIIVEK